MLHPSTSSVAPSNGPISVGISGSLQLELISSHPHDQIHVLKQLLLDPLPEPTLGLEPDLKLREGQQLLLVLLLKTYLNL